MKCRQNVAGTPVGNRLILYNATVNGYNCEDDE
jgi:hypothetical protein